MKTGAKFAVLTVLIVANFTAVCAEFPHAEPPPNDPCLTNRLGRSWSEPIYNGYLIADGKYIEAPYVVEQRGYKTMVNGEQVARIDPRTVLPLPPPEPVTEDPGVPDDLTEDTPLGTMAMHPKTKARRRYFDHIGLSGEERVGKMIEYFESLPCVSKVVDTGQPGGQKNSRNIRIYGVNDEELSSNVLLAPKPPRKLPSDSKIYEWTTGEFSEMRSALQAGALIFVRNGRVVAERGYPDRQPERRWDDIFGTLAGEMSPDEKLNRLQALGFVPKVFSLEQANGFFPVTYFKPTEQLWQRLDGDEAWKDGAADRLNALTNGWHKITPAFAKTTSDSDDIEPEKTTEDTHADDELESTNNITSSAYAMQNSEVNDDGKNHITAADATRDPRPKEPSEMTAKSSAVYVVMPVLGFIAILIGLLFFRHTKKRCQSHYISILVDLSH